MRSSTHATERLDPQLLQVTKKRRFSPFFSSVSGDLQVLQVTYSTILVVRWANYGNGGEITDIASQDVLQLFLLEFTPNDQPLAAIDRPTGTQFGKQELRDVLIETLHTLADIADVGKDSLLITLTQHLRRGDFVAPPAFTCKIWVL